MPFYKYCCKKCSRDIESCHSMTLEPSVCSDLPDCECEEKGEVKKDLSENSFSRDEDFEEESGTEETGELVEETIEETKEEVEKRKKDLKERDFDPKEKK